MKNILITAIGSFSARSIIDSLRPLTSGKLVGCDIYPKEWHHVSKSLDEVLKAPLVSNEKEYLSFILDICFEFKINLIIPLTDIEVDFFDKHRRLFLKKNIIVTIGNKNFISIARNKLKLSQFVLKNNLDYIQTYKFSELTSAQFPVIGKIVNGRSSEGLIRLTDINELNSITDYSNYVFQQIIEGPIYTVDYIRNELNGDFYAVPRCELLRTKNGAGMTVEVVHSNDLIQLSNKIGILLDIHGCVNMEFIKEEDKLYLIDINPRPSAGIGFTKLAGYDMIQNLYHLYNSNEIDSSTQFNNMIAEKKMVEVINVLNE